MSIPKVDPVIATHIKWLGFVQPTGLVVSAPTLAQAGVVLNHRDAEGQNRLQKLAPPPPQPVDSKRNIPEFRDFATYVLGWDFSPAGYAGTAESPVPPELEIVLPDGSERISPSFAVRTTPHTTRHGPDSSPSLHGQKQSNVTSEWQLLVNVCAPTEDFDQLPSGSSRSSHQIMEQLLRQTDVPAGMLFNGSSVRLISAPRGESSGWLDFKIEDMLTSDGRLILAAMLELLGQTRLLASGTHRNLAFLLRESRKYQNIVTERLAEQVLHALYELVRGFQIAHDISTGVLLQRLLDDDPDEIYGGLLTLVMRLIFLLYSEERGMLPHDSVYESSYSLAGLHKRLQEDAALYPDTSDQRFGAYAQIISLSRIIHKGAKLGVTQLPKRQGNLFDPDRYPFLEGRDSDHRIDSANHTRVVAPLVPDGTIYRVLEKLTMLQGERISYRALDVEHIGSVYETMMGFKLEKATGQSISIKSVKKHGAPTTIDIEALLHIDPAGRAKWVLDHTNRKLTSKVNDAVQKANSLNDILAALGSITDKNATPDFVPPGAMVLQPSEERRRTGSHYTPRELSDPIVEKTLEPVFDRLERDQGGPPTPKQILDLKICDPAMGSGAFLVAACRILGNKLVEAWDTYGLTHKIPSDETREILAYRLVAQSCLYGIDLNPKAVELAKLSLWLFTLARDHPLTFLDHALRHGDSLLGLSLKQIRAFHWRMLAPKSQGILDTGEVSERLGEVKRLRKQIQNAGDQHTNEMFFTLLLQAESELRHVRIYGDLVLASLFGSKHPREREQLREQYETLVNQEKTEQRQEQLEKSRMTVSTLAPFHWELEFPEVFDRTNPGFDTMVGNPPFLGGTRSSTVLGSAYTGWLAILHEETDSRADLVAHFFRRSYDLLRENGSLGLIATNTIAQGETRATGLRHICNSGGNVFCARRRVKWPGLAAVVVSVVHIFKGRFDGERLLDHKPVNMVTAYLFHQGGNEDPIRLTENLGISFKGMDVLGMGFTFDDTDKKNVASSLESMRGLIEKDPRNQQIICPYIGGEEINTAPNHAHHRFVINFEDMPLKRAEINGHWKDAEGKQRNEWLAMGIVPKDYPGPVAEDWPDLVNILKQKAWPERQKLGRSTEAMARKTRWWQFARTRPALRNKTSGMQRLISVAGIGKHLAFTFLPMNMVYANSLIVFSLDSYASFCVLQSRVHEIWARFLGSSLKDWLRYTPSDCFETFPFPKSWEYRFTLENAGEQYFRHRAHIMEERNEGLTKTYNRFHDPIEDSPEIEKLRELHAELDRIVLDSYGWQDLSLECDFFLEYEVDDEGKHGQQKPYRYRWPDHTRDEVLARLLKLNTQRAADEHTLDK